MSGRIRTIKPELLEDAITAGLTDTAFRLFIGCILLADDYGNLRYEPAWVRVQVLWKRPVSDEAFTAAMGELDALITAYEVKGQRYGAIKNWDKHQKVSHPGKPRVPARPETLPKPSGEPPETLVPDLRSPTTITDHDQDPDRSVAPGTASAVEARSRFQDAVASATGKRFVLARAPFHDQAIADAVNGHAPRGPIASKLDWLAVVVAEWVKVTNPKYSGGWVPSKLLDWLNAGKPDRESGPIRGSEITRQPYDPNAPWMKVGA